MVFWLLLGGSAGRRATIEMSEEVTIPGTCFLPQGQDGVTVRVCAVVVRRGTRTGAHYVAYVRSAGCWLEYDDHVARKVSFDTVQLGAAQTARLVLCEKLDRQVPVHMCQRQREHDVIDDLEDSGDEEVEKQDRQVPVRMCQRQRGRDVIDDLEDSGDEGVDVNPKRARVVTASAPPEQRRRRRSGGESAEDHLMCMCKGVHGVHDVHMCASV